MIFFHETFPIEWNSDNTTNNNNNYNEVRNKSIDFAVTKSMQPPEK